MANFAFVYRNRPENYARLTPEDMQKQMQRWQAWFAEGTEQGWLVNTGDALTREGRLVDSKKLVADGPFVEAKEVVGGFSLVDAADIDAAAEIAKDCPALAIGGSVEVRPLAGYMPLKR
jgi:hypothetical protein